MSKIELSANAVCFESESGQSVSRWNDPTSVQMAMYFMNLAMICQEKGKPFFFIVPPGYGGSITRNVDGLVLENLNQEDWCNRL